MLGALADRVDRAFRLAGTAADAFVADLMSMINKLLFMYFLLYVKYNIIFGKSK